MNDGVECSGADRMPSIPVDRAVIDRIVEGEDAVLLVGPRECERRVPASLLPQDVSDGEVVIVEHSHGEVRITGVDAWLTSARRSSLARRMERIRAERRGGRFDRDR